MRGRERDGKDEREMTEREERGERRRRRRERDGKDEREMMDGEHKHSDLVRAACSRGLPTFPPITLIFLGPLPWPASRYIANATFQS